MPGHGGCHALGLGGIQQPLDADQMRQHRERQIVVDAEVDEAGDLVDACPGELADHGGTVLRRAEQRAAAGEALVRVLDDQLPVENRIEPEPLASPCIRSIELRR